MSPTFQHMMRAPMMRAYLIMEGIGMSVVYMSKTESLLKQTVAFHRSANDMIPLKKNVAVSGPKRW